MWMRYVSETFEETHSIQLIKGVVSGKKPEHYKHNSLKGRSKGVYNICFDLSNISIAYHEKKKKNTSHFSTTMTNERFLL